jgi:hypothetical protein
MPQDPDHEEKSLADELISEAFRDVPPEEDGPRDPGWLRWAKFLALIAGAALVVGACFACADYVAQYTNKTWSGRVRAENIVKRDSLEKLQWRFAIGACVGGGLGLAYVVRCLVRRVDP